MGEASNKKMNRDDAHKRVVDLQKEIVRKRDMISLELDELRRRRAEAMIRAKASAKLAGVGLLGIAVTGSLLNALMDLFRHDKPEEEVVALDVGESRRDSVTAALISAVTSMVIGEVRGYAMNYARNKLRERLDLGRQHIETRINSSRSGSSDNDGNHKSVA